MDKSAIVMIIVGVAIIWGGLAGSIAIAVIKSKQAKKN